MSYLLDTNIVSLIIKRNLEIYQKIEDVKAQRKTIFISCITYFEIKRGLLAVAAPKQRERFIEKAAEIHADLILRGLPIQTEDILIAATAIVKSLIVVSNDGDLLRVEGLSLENWVEL
ncbi:MAG: type II toxin-antitoxin system VapC family toxin [Microcystis aeruginosa Ma_AC_P_19900807_S299]|nr:MAG: type II toxin-antitoxin system VapC family toxin [Microcystis aeruginosa Ma_AC_P_19900807_S299]